MKPLEDVLVVSVEQAIAAPFCTRQLADLGARVIKVERPLRGDFARQYDDRVKGLSSHFVWTNRGKESLAVDLKSPLGQDILSRLLRRADVFVENLGPGAAKRLGLDADTLVGAHPRLVACAISGYGETGPFAQRKAYDLLIQCEAGLLSVTGTPEVPSKVGISLADIAAGMYALTGILTALRVRSQTGQGRAVRVALLDALAEWMGYPMLYAAYGGTPPPRTGARHATIFPYGPYRTREGEEIFLAVQNEREWRRLAEGVLGRPDLGQDERYRDNRQRLAHRGELQPILEAVLGALDAQELEGRLEAANIAHARLRQAADLMTHPQLRARGRFLPTATPGGPIETLRPPVRAGYDDPPDSVPALGGGNRKILEELGFGEDEIRAVQAQAT